jgi:hypothetical protein
MTTYYIIEIYPTARHNTSKPVEFVFQYEYAAKEFVSKMIAIGVDNHRIEFHTVKDGWVERY